MTIETVETPQGEVKVPVFIEKSKGSGKQAANEIIKKYDKIRREKTFRKIVDANEKKKKSKNVEIIKDIRNSAAKKSTKITAKKNLNRYKAMKRTKKTYLVNEEDLETIDHNEPQEDLFKRESILAAANKVFDFNKFKKQQEDAIKNFNDNLLENTETIIYIDDINLDDARDNKNLKISAKKISDKYRKLRKRKATEREQQIQEIIEEFKLPKKRKKRQTDKARVLAAKKISKKYKDIRFR